MVLAGNKHCILNLSYVDTVWPQVLSSRGRLSSTVGSISAVSRVIEPSSTVAGQEVARSDTSSIVSRGDTIDLERETNSGTLTSEVPVFLKK